MTRLPTLNNRRGALIATLGILAGALLLLLGFGGYKALRLWRLTDSLQEHLDALQSIVERGGDLSAVGDNLYGAQNDLNVIQNEIAPLVPLTRHLAWVPRYGGDIRAAPGLLDTAEALMNAGTVAYDALEPVVTLVEGNTDSAVSLPRVLDLLSNACPNLQVAQEHLEIASDHRVLVDQSSLSTRTSALVSRLDRYLPLMRTALQGTCMLSDLLGSAEPRTYLVLAQNNDELRATGGFISAIGKLVLRQGEIAEITFEDSYQVDDFTQPYPDSPAPFLRYMGIDQWVFRDANWSPDFPTAAQKAVELYQISRDLEVDGVLAVDQFALEALVGALEPLYVEGWPEPVTEENVRSLIQLAWSPTEEENQSDSLAGWWKQRKRFMNDLIGAMRNELETSPGQVDWLGVAQAVFQILEESHLQIWLTEDTGTATQLLSQRGWDGAVSQTDGDYLMVVDSNLGFNKANAVVERHVNYRVLVSVDGTAQATLTVRHVNAATGNGACNPWPHYGANYDDIVHRCYWDYLRVLVPSDSRLWAATAHPIAADLLITERRQAGTVDVLPEEKGKAVFGSFLVLPRGQEALTRFVYQLPREIVEQTEAGWRYRLLVQKQAGIKAFPLHVTLALPPGSKVLAVLLPDEVQHDSIVEHPDPSTVQLDLQLNKDQVIEVLFRFPDP